MPRRNVDELSNWFNGVITSAAADQLPQGASPRGRNSAFKALGEATAVIGKRRGAQTRNATALTGSPGIIGGFQFKKRSGTKFNLLVSDTGRLDQLNTNDTTSVINALAFTSGTHYPCFAVANDLCFIVNDVDQKKTDGTTVQAFGITRPAAPTAAAAAGGAMATGVWDVALTYFNSATGNESSSSDYTSVTLTAGNQKINVSWLAPADTQVTHVRVYARQQTAGVNGYRAVAGATPAADATYGGYAPATLATVLDISAVQYGAFTLLAPGTSENNPPPAATQYPTLHQQRLFLADSGNVYYSNLKNNVAYPEAFNANNVQPVNPNDGDTIIGMASHNGVLFVFKKFSIYTISGSDPGSWDVQLLTKDYGLSSHRSIVSAGGNLYWWAGALGPAVLAGGTITPLGINFISESISADVLNHQGFASVSGAADEANQTILWTVPEVTQTRNSLLIPFNYKLKRFPAEFWTPFDVYSLWSVETADKLQTLYMGNYGGQAFQWWVATNDGVPSGTSTGTVTSSTSTTLTDSTAAFVTTGAGLKERYVYVLSSDRTTMQRRRISANSATQLTVTPAWDVNPNATNTYVVGGIDFQIDTPEYPGSTFMKKRYELLFLSVSSLDNDVVLDVDIFVSGNTDEPKRTKEFALTTGSGAEYDAATSLYDSTAFAGSNTATVGKLRAACVGYSWRGRIRNIQADKEVLINAVSMQSVPLGINR